MELGEMNNIRQHCMKAHFKEDGELGEMHNDLDGKNLQRVKSNVISRQCNQKDGPAPWIVSLLADRDVGVTLCIEAHRKLVLAQLLDIGSDVLGSSFLFASYFTSSSVIFADADCAR
jgi:hypothetical protein